MLTAMWNFIKRHKKKFIFTGAIIGGAVYLGHYARRKLKELQELETAECLSNARRQHHFDSNQRTCNMTVLSMLPTLRSALLTALDAESITEELRTKPSNKLELWDKLKIISFSRAVAALYSSCMLVMMLRVQLNIIGGYMYIDSMAEHDPQAVTTQKTSPMIQQKYLANIEYILNEGLAKLIAEVKTATERVIGSLPLTHKLSLQEVEGLLRQICVLVERYQGDGCRDSPLARFMLPLDITHEKQSGSSSEEEELTLLQLERETRDMIESQDFDMILRLCVETSLTRLIDKVAVCYSPLNSEHFVNPHEVSVALAKVIPVMSGLVHSVTGDSPNPIVQELLLRDEVKDFAANVYEAFCLPRTSASG